MTSTVSEHPPQGVAERIIKVEAPTLQRRLRVAHVSMTLQTGGLERLLVDMARYHDANRFEPEFYALDTMGPPADDIRQYGCPAHSARLNLIGKRGVMRLLERLFKRHQIDIVHTHNTYAHYFGTFAARRAGVPIVVNSQHGRGCGIGWKLAVRFVVANRFADRVVGVSDDSALACRQIDPLSTGKITRQWNGIDVERFELRGPKQEPTAITVSRLSPEKDLATLLQAVATVVRDVPDFQLRIVGDGPERAGLESLTDQLQLRQHVTFLGERSDVPDQLANAGFYVASSLTEGISLTLLEAHAVGLPIVATSVGGNPEIVVENETGRLVPPREPETLARAIIQMCRQPERWSEMGRRGRQRVEDNFDVRKTVAGYESIYEDLWARRRSPKN
ncbi:GDP-mannose-dependent alpha-(1-6)-phosphatidylinositol monomannoside mannosyltransferase [Maioricimonas rarisocia]|uniref:GDP-mannose-dependent alpha-(1-6)-phosphatidylinositol monomannoside mannosyltransferase n=1 Tax=Maioricimonas rarisocia TaxID=2528026 RepID=A0A517Z7H0_9PLAN|nr:glycosyltransferase [Maioricimonas rarisocia]QDU38394.1 GDP-mannose-dependent alpha-(1-6)-phosphatidylinositol monomannoside mannosyltransferase [Maioricimonas rarisocia]